MDGCVVQTEVGATGEVHHLPNHPGTRDRDRPPAPSRTTSGDPPPGLPTPCGRCGWRMMVRSACLWRSDIFLPSLADLPVMAVRGLPAGSDT